MKGLVKDPAAFGTPLFAPRLVYSAAQVHGWFLYHRLAQNELSKGAKAIESMLKLMAGSSLKLPAVKRYPIRKSHDAIKAADGVN